MNRQILEKPFNPEQIKQREGNFGKKLDYIEGHAVIQRLNDAFDADWSFAIIQHETLKETDEVIVQGELKAGNVVKMQFGSSRITRARESGDIISLADDLKAAATDALKKAATLFGVGLHLYRNDRPQGGYSQQGSQRNSDNLPPKGNCNGNNLPAGGNRNGSNNPGNGGNGSGSNGGNGNGGNGSGGSNGNGNNRPSGSDGNGSGRLSAKQYQYIQRLNEDMGKNSADLNKKCQEMFGTVAQFLSKGDASAMIEYMLAQ